MLFETGASWSSRNNFPFLIIPNVFTYDEVEHHDTPSYIRKTVENDRNWIKLITNGSGFWHLEMNFGFSQK